MPEEYEVNPVKFITVGTIGPPGERTFHLQAGDDDTLVTLTVEKTQAKALAEGTLRLLDEIEEKLTLKPADAKRGQMDLDLHEPILPAFRVAQMNLVFDQSLDLMTVVAHELITEDEPGEPSVAPASLSVVHLSRLGPRVVLVNDTSHLSKDEKKG